jgi:hypothetical protein
VLALQVIPQRSSSGGGSGGKRGGRSSDDPDLVEAGGEPVSTTVVSTKEPTVKWISRVDQTQEESELEDLAAEIVGDTLTGDLVKANRDFRGYRDLVGFFAREFNPSGDAAILPKIMITSRSGSRASSSKQ